MLETITACEMQALEQSFMAQTGVPALALMEQAARAVTAVLLRRLPSKGRVLFLCGRGSNGGDGFAAARQWAECGGDAVVWALPGDPTTDPARAERTLLHLHGIAVLPLKDPLPPLPPDTRLIVDALFGTGLSRPLVGLAARLVALANESAAPVVAVDVPSGLDATTGEALGPAVLAAETVTFHRLKQGLLLRAGRRHAGRITSAPILIPPDYGQAPGLLVLTDEDAAAMRLPRPADGHKGTFGRAVILAGCPGMAGAAALCASACLRGGAGLVTVACRASILPLVQQLVPCATCLPLVEQDGVLTPQALRDFTRLLSQADAAAVGCGLGTGEDLLPFLDALAQADCPVVWDADALNLRAAHPERFGPVKPADILTPHPGEAARLLNVPASAVSEDPLGALSRLQAAQGGTVLLKGATTLLTDGRTVCANLSGTPAMAKGGSGDVLTGLMAALLCQRARWGLTTLQTAQLAAFLHGRAGERAALGRGEDSLLATELVDAIQ